ncbi:MAG: 50S ribosomal protein L31e [Candidatus Bathyarchaeota archaeon]|nr:50S ribosomal protein L31e [Candidatus Bathyarchaeota archaeon]
MSELERIYTVPLKEAWNAQRYRRSERAMMVLKAFTIRHMKATTVTVDTSVNEAIWARGIKSPPHKIRVKMTKDDEGNVTVTMAEVDAKAEAKEARAEAKEKTKAKPKAKAEKKEKPKAEAKEEPKAEAKAEPKVEAEKKE